MKKNALPVFLSVVSILISVLIIRNELKDYSLFVKPGLFQFFRSFSFYIAGVFSFAILIGCVVSFLQKKSVIPFIPVLIMGAGFLIFLQIQNMTQRIHPDNIIFRNGYYYSTLTGEKLNGTYEEYYFYGNYIKLQYKNGEHYGQWVYFHKNDLIHFGVYPENENLKKEVCKITESDISAIDCWAEGDVYSIGIYIYHPKNTSKKAMNNLFALCSKCIAPVFQYQFVEVFEVSESGCKTLFESKE